MSIAGRLISAIRIRVVDRHVIESTGDTAWNVNCRDDPFELAIFVMHDWHVLGCALQPFAECQSVRARNCNRVPIAYGRLSM